jgi:O-antigen/teichoic acid export membrane protein
MLLLLYGELYLSSHTILSILAVNIIIESIANINSKVLYSKNLEKKMLPRIFVGILANISLNIILIPLMGINGVALSTVISIIIVEFFYDFFDPVLRDIHFFKLKSIFLIPTK